MIDLGETKARMDKVIGFVREELTTIRTGRATPALVENIMINAYGGGTKMRVMEMAGVVASDAQSLVISPYDASTIGEIRRDIEAANIGLTPIIDNNVIRIAVPALTSERRLEFIKMMHAKLEDGRVKVRQIRHELMGDLKKMGESREINEDEKRKSEEDLQKITDKSMEEIQELGEKKEKELMGN
jgi:ribosome recycling factor